MVAALVTDIEIPRVGSRLRRIWLEGEPWKTTSAAAVKAVALEKDDIVEPEQLATAIAEAEVAAARERALQLLGYRERSRAELSTKLHEDGYPPSTVADIIEAFDRTGLLDDRRFAESFVRSHAARGLGARRIARELARAGVDDALVVEVMQPDDTQPSEHERALAIARRMVTSTSDVRKLAARLARKGYDLDTSFAAAREAASEAEEQADLP